MTTLALVCYLWAAVGIGSRIAMALMGERWKEWELGSAYTERRPAWVVAAAAVGLALILVTWYVALFGEARLGWIVAVLVSLTGIKIGALLLRYDQFRAFASRMLSSPVRMRTLNAGVLVFSLGLVLMGALLYS